MFHYSHYNLTYGHRTASLVISIHCEWLREYCLIFIFTMKGINFIVLDLDFRYACTLLAIRLSHSSQ